MVIKKWGRFLCIGSTVVAVILLGVDKYIRHTILEPVATLQEWLDVSRWRYISYGMHIIALIILLVNMVYFRLQKRYRWVAVIQAILFFHFAFLA